MCVSLKKREREREIRLCGSRRDAGLHVAIAIAVEEVWLGPELQEMHCLLLFLLLLHLDHGTDDLKAEEASCR
jgi:hypothetical protein